MPQTQIYKHNLKYIDYGITPVAISADGKLSATLHPKCDRTAIICNINGKIITKLEGHQSKITSIQFSPDGQYIATNSYSNFVIIWDLKGNCKAVLNHNKKMADFICFSPDGKYIATSYICPCIAIVWDLNGKKIATLSKHKGQINTVTFSRSSKFIATTSEDHTTKIWNPSNGECFGTLYGHTSGVNSAIFDTNEWLLVTTSNDCTAKVWDLWSTYNSNLIFKGNCLKTLEGHRNIVCSATFSPDKQHIATTSYDCTTKIWNTLSGKCEETLEGHRYCVTSASFSPNGTLIATISDDHTAKIWDLTTKGSITLKESGTAAYSANFNDKGICSIIAYMCDDFDLAHPDTTKKTRLVLLKNIKSMSLPNLYVADEADFVTI